MNSDWPYTLLPADAYDDEVLVRLEDAYHEADRTSGEAQRVYRRILVYLACASTAIALAFLLYDEAEAHWMLILLGVVLNKITKRGTSHGYYEQYVYTYDEDGKRNRRRASTSSSAKKRSSGGARKQSTDRS